MAKDNIYTFLHKGLRRALFKQLTELAQLDEANPVAVYQCLDDCLLLLADIQRHQQLHYQFIQPLLPDFDQFQQEYEKFEQQLVTLSQQANYIQTMPAVICGQTLHQFYLQLSLFCAELLNQMHQRETQIMQYLWQSHTDEQLQAVKNLTKQQLSPQEQLDDLLLTLPALTETERLTLLMALQKQLPPASFLAVLNQLQPELNATQQHSLNKNLSTNLSTVCSL